jgi:hypothetical protein
VSEAGVRARLAALRESIARAAAAAGRDAEGVGLIGVAKRQPAGLVACAVRAGLADVGESYVQEAARKIPEVERALADAPPAPRPRWHLVGRLQRNKAREAARWFDVVHSVDRLALAVELDRRAAELGRRLDTLVQVNLSGEPQKGGSPPEALSGLLETLAPLARLRVVGLMTVPAAAPDPEAARPAFRRLRELRDALRGKPGAEHLAELSMGMSGDYAVAIEEGATWVRIGTAIFGPREG